MKHQTSKVFKWMNKCWLLLKAKQAKSTVKHNEKSKPVGFRGVSIHIYIIRQINKQINRWLVNSANKSITICIHICAYLSPPKWWFSSLLEFLTSLHCSIFFLANFHYSDNWPFYPYPKIHPGNLWFFQCGVHPNWTWYCLKHFSKHFKVCVRGWQNTNHKWDWEYATTMLTHQKTIRSLISRKWKNTICALLGGFAHFLLATWKKSVPHLPGEGC